MSNKQQLQEENTALVEYADEVILGRMNSAWRQALAIVTENSFTEGTIFPDDPILTDWEIARQTGWGGSGFVALSSDRARGAFWPFFRTEMELSQIRAIGRQIAVADPMGKSVVRNVTNYTDGDGFNYQFQPKDKTDPAAVALCQQAQQALDQFIETNEIVGKKERELIEETMPAGEALVCLKDSDDGIPRVRIRSTDHLREPPDAHKIEDYYSLPSGMDWSFGVAAPMDDAEDVQGYFAWWYGMPDNWEFLPEARCEHVKLNVPADVKRGLSEFYSTYREIQKVASGIFAAAKGAEIQASIAWIEKVDKGIPQAAVENMTATPGSFVQQFNKGQTTRQVRVTPTLSGTKITTDHDFMYGPAGQPRGAMLIEVFAAVARRVGATYSMPEWMISGDASNNNQASSITAGSSFDVAMQSNQGAWSKVWAKVCWKALALMSFDTDQLKQSLTLEVKGNQVASREELTDEKIRIMRLEGGVLSKRTYSTEVGLDFDEEQANIAQETPPPPIIAAGGIEGKYNMTQATADQKASAAGVQIGAAPQPGVEPTQPTYEQLVFSVLDKQAAKMLTPERAPITEAVEQPPIAMTPRQYFEQVHKSDTDELPSRLKAIEFYKALTDRPLDIADEFIRETEQMLTASKIVEAVEEQNRQIAERERTLKEEFERDKQHAAELEAALAVLEAKVATPIEYDFVPERDADGIITRVNRVAKNGA